MKRRAKSSPSWNAPAFARSMAGRVIADSQVWLRFLRKEAGLVWALHRRKIQIQGSPRLLLAFGRCFPS